MFFIIPVGSEECVRKLPYLTIGLIVINTIIWLITNSLVGGQVKALEEIDKRLFEIESRYLYRIIETDPNLLTRLTPEKLRQMVESGDIIPPESEDFQQWKSLYEDYQLKKNKMVFEGYGFKPSNVDFFRIISSIFIHANFLHLLFNMLFLWMVGCNIEDDWTWKIFLGLYLTSGVVACLFHAAAFPKSNVPLIGASGAIAGVMGAFMIRHFKTKIRFIYFLWIFVTKPFFGTFATYAGIALPFWFAQQILGASWSSGASGVAYWAHIGGFIFGATIGASFKFFGVEKKYIEPMVEESFEKLKLSSKMKMVNKMLDASDTAGAISLLLQIISEEPQNFDAPLNACPYLFRKGKSKQCNGNVQ